MIPTFLTREGRQVRTSRAQNGAVYNMAIPQEGNLLVKRIGQVILPAGAVAICAAAQWINYPIRGTPREKDGKPKLNAPVPRTRGGHPDLCGVWESIPPQGGTSPVSLGDTTTEDLNVFDLQNNHPAWAKIPMKPETEALFQRRLKGLAANRPSAQCLPHGIPDAMQSIGLGRTANSLLRGWSPGCHPVECTNKVG